MEVSGQRRESGYVLPHAGPERESPLDINVSLTVTDDEYFFGS